MRPTQNSKLKYVILLEVKVTLSPLQLEMHQSIHTAEKDIEGCLPSSKQNKEIQGD